MITKKFNGILHFLVQAKIEPGNINFVQISPTLQATKSNYTRIHEGKTPLYLEYFNGTNKVKVLVDSLQSEQGGRFLRKRNRNIIVEIDEYQDIEIKNDDFIWLTLGQIKKLLSFNNVVNMDTRTVISCISFGSYSKESLDLLYAFNYRDYESKPVHHSFLTSLLSKDGQVNDLGQILAWITKLKFNTELNINKAPLQHIKNWEYTNGEIKHIDNKYFSIIGVKVQITSREVHNWSQPMLKPAQEGIIAFIVKKINGIYHFLVQAKMEVGNFDLLEFAPTVQCLTGNYRKGHNEYSIPYLEEILNAKEEQIWYSSYQSEEGGRFYQEQNLNMIVEAEDNFKGEVEPNYCWMTLNQLVSFVGYNNYLNIAARSLLAAIRFN
jgi:oxidase EvaA